MKCQFRGRLALYGRNNKQIESLGNEGKTQNMTN